MKYAIIPVTLTIVAAALADYMVRKAARRATLTLQDQMKEAHAALIAMDEYAVSLVKRNTQLSAEIVKLKDQLKGPR